MDSVKNLWTPYQGDVNEKLQELERNINEDNLQEAVSCMFDLESALGEESLNYWVSDCCENFVTGEVIKNIIKEIFENGEWFTIDGDITDMNNLIDDKWYCCEMEDNNIFVYELNNETIRDMYKGIKEDF